MPVTTVVLAGRLVDVVAGEVLEDRAVLVYGDRVVDVVAVDDAPLDATIVDLTDRWVVPGLIDCHAHLVGDMDNGHGYASVVDSSQARDALTGVRNARDTVLAGFTTVRDVGTFRAFTDVALRDAIVDGWVPGPRMLCAGAYVTCPGGGGDITGLPPEVDARVPAELRVGVVRDVDDVREAVRRIVAGGADFIKVIATGAVLTEGTLPGEVELDEAQLRAAVEEAAALGVHVAAHAHGAEGIKLAVRAGVRSIEHGSLMDDEAIALMVEHGTWLVADIYNGDFIQETGERDGWSAETMRKNAETTQTQRDGFRKAVAAGVRIAYGTDSGVYPWADAARQLPYMVRHGLTPMQALQSATIRAAECLDRDSDVGSLRPGRYADLVALGTDPLADDLRAFATVPFVMKGGEIVKDDPF
ncbi:MAG TPA: amidohydrolase family protein [Candidatus Nanopelagicales bacterium]|nr:amidohydrolase family protein [Candidatus Nanopelagicales bacterium]